MHTRKVKLTADKFQQSFARKTFQLQSYEKVYAMYVFCISLWMTCEQSLSFKKCPWLQQQLAISEWSLLSGRLKRKLPLFILGKQCIVSVPISAIVLVATVIHYGPSNKNVQKNSANTRKWTLSRRVPSCATFASPSKPVVRVTAARGHPLSAQNAYLATVAAC